MFGRDWGMAEVSERAAVLALVAAASESGIEWHRAATIIDQAGSALRVLRRDWSGLEPFDVEQAEQLAKLVPPDSVQRYVDLIEELRGRGISAVTVLDNEYPDNLRWVYNRPPFLFIRGQLLEQDNRSVAVVGTRKPSEAGVEQARRLAQELARKGVTVLSGLALGIDAVAHAGALDAGGRTVAVMGTGIESIYPRENEDLAGRILQQGGALVSQFWPEAPPTRYSFPMRNVVMSGMAIGTVVVEANSRSGAKLQARLALDHGKRLFLVESLVMREEWAQRYARHPGTTVVRSVDDILDVLVAMARPMEQLRLG
jgi:DNA processing protein